mmetsp:Transcript_71356/g.118592  ORF Transcript_71356/g.118592 Transcript_71356/m.118592 type:complete len:458 (+) Transcript_71356:184-1557(+)
MHIATGCFVGCPVPTTRRSVRASSRVCRPLLAGLLLQACAASHGARLAGTVPKGGGTALYPKASLYNRSLLGLPADAQFLFWHVPKTGGTSMIKVIYGQMRLRACDEKRSIKSDKQPSTNRNSSKQDVQARIASGLCQAFDTEDGYLKSRLQFLRAPRLILLSRSPRSHVVSLYAHCQMYPPHGKPEHGYTPVAFDDWLLLWANGSEHGGESPRGKMPHPAEGEAPGKTMSRFCHYVPLDFQTTLLGAPLDEGPSMTASALEREGSGRSAAMAMARLASAVDYVQPAAQLGLAARPQWAQALKDFSMDDRLDLALRHVDSAWAVGVIEEFSAFVCMLGLLLHGEPIGGCDCVTPLAANAKHARDNTDATLAIRQSLLADQSRGARYVDMFTRRDRILYEAHQRRWQRDRSVLEAECRAIAKNGPNGRVAPFRQNAERVGSGWGWQWHQEEGRRGVPL